MSRPDNPAKKLDRQLPLSFDVKVSRARDDLVEAPSIQAALTAVEQWPEWASYVLVLAGPTGSGKSHLAHIWQEYASAQIVDMSQSANQLVALAKTSPLLIEDIDRSALDETKLFHVLNAVKQAQQTILLTARNWPSAWPVQLPDLLSRLKAATIVEIGEPDELLLQQVLFKLFADRQIEIDEKVVKYLVMRMERSLASAQRVVDLMDQLALSRKTSINRNIASDVLSMLENEGSEVLSRK